VVGKLAERLSDPARSGVYRIETVEALEEAAALNSYPLVRVELGHVTSKSGLLDAVARSAALPDSFAPNWIVLRESLTDLSWTPASGFVLLLSGFEAAQRDVPEDFTQLLEVLIEAAADWRGRGKPFFVAFLDPGGAAPVAPLYKWHRQRT